MEGKGPLHNLLYELAKLPGVGPKSAERLAYHILEGTEPEAQALARAIVDAKEQIRECSICHDWTDGDPCPICANSERDRSMICVVEGPKDVLAMERSGSYRGLYHVLHGLIVPERGILPADLRLKELYERLKSEEVKEVILATNPTKNGDTTALYILNHLEDVPIKISRLAYGIPVGGDLEYFDEMTVSMAMKNRISVQK
ncbi:MAG: recombination mediator RecR [Tissierellia bacterium]|nr:recombination mediator RecR [Tissierellia bacterium]